MVEYATGSFGDTMVNTIGGKELIYEFKTEIMMAFVCILFGVMANSYIGCGYDMDNNGTWVYGNCVEIKEYDDMKRWMRTDEKLQYQDFKLKDDVEVKFKTVISMPIATTTTTTSTLSCPKLVCPPQRDCVCKCDICTKCPTPQYEFTPEQVKWMLNYKPRFGMSGYQSGGWDAKDDWLEYLEVEGRPKFKSRPSPTGWTNTLKGKNESTYCFVNLGNHFYLNRTPDENGRKRWSWDDSQCKKSYLRINHL